MTKSKAGRVALDFADTKPKAPHFARDFDAYVCEGDSISCTFDGFEFTARIYRDDCGDSPDERDMGFWPSRNPNDAGYIGAKSERTFRRYTAHAHEVMRAWEAGEWFYCGVAVTASRNGVELTEEFAHALWGIDCNYPLGDKRRKPNAYLRVVANELASEALDTARMKLKTLCAQAA